MLVIIIGLVYYITLGDSGSVVEPFDDSKIRNQIRQRDSLIGIYEMRFDSLMSISDSLTSVNDSLENIKPAIQNQYDEIYKFNRSANATQLDSVIRASWR
jgi:hypothetical protein